MSTIQDIAKKFEVNEAHVLQLKEGMQVTWGHIGSDCYEFIDSYDSETEMIAEMTLDAGRLQEYTSYCGWQLSDWDWLDTVRKNGHSIMELGQAAWDASHR